MLLVVVSVVVVAVVAVVVIVVIVVVIVVITITLPTREIRITAISATREEKIRGNENVRGSKEKKLSIQGVSLTCRWSVFLPFFPIISFSPGRLRWHCVETNSAFFSFLSFPISVCLS